MKNYHVSYTPEAEKIIGKLDNSVRKRISDWIMTNLEGCENPRWQGKALKGNLKNYWRYRVGDCRIIAQIQDDKIIILVVDVDKLNDIYKK